MKTGIHQQLALASALAFVSACTDAGQDSTLSSKETGSGTRIRYSYDPLGRLIQAATSEGTGVQYSYDAVGNITAVRRLAADTLGIVDFSPRTGAIAATVTVYGSGFEPDAASNTVTFNGTAAAISAATQTTLVVSVPDGATSGKIAVSNTKGNATSPTDFTVGGTSSEPVIVGFTPLVGTQGTVVTLVGANFQSDARDDKVMLGGHLSEILTGAQSHTVTQLRFTVPSATASGLIELTTPFGTALSTSEFLSVPATVTPADVEFTGRLSVGGPALTVTTTTAGKKAALLFDATAHPKLHLLAVGGNFATGLSADIYGPDASKIDTLPLTNNSTGDFSAVLAANGTYMIILKPSPSDKGTVQLSLVADAARKAFAVDGTNAVSLGSGQNQRFGFIAQAGTGYGLAVTDLSFTPSGGSMAATLRKADGTSLITCPFPASGSCDFPPSSFPTTDTYFVDFDPAGLNAASFNAMLTTDASGSIAIDAPAPTPVTIARAGQNARYTFSGTAGQLVSAAFSGNALDDGNATSVNSTQVLVYKPSSSVAFASRSFNTRDAGAAIDLALPETGTYAIQINPSGLDSGSVNLQLQSDASGAMVLDGSTNVSLSPGQNGRFSFAAQSGKGYGLAITGLSFAPAGGSLAVTLLKPDGSSTGVSCPFSSDGSCDFDPVNFASTGTYLLDFDPAGLAAASFQALLSTDASGVVAIDASTPTPVAIARPGQNARYSFTGSAGQIVSVVVNGSTLDDGNSSTPSSTQVLLFKPSNSSGALNGGTFNAFAGGLAFDQALPETGTYTVAIKPSGLDSGNVNLQVKSYAAGALAMDDSTPVTLTSGQNGRFSFSAQAGTGYGFAITALGFTPSSGTPPPGMNVTLLKPDGTAIGTPCSLSASGSCDLDPSNFATSGTYSLNLDPSGTYATNFNVVLSTDATGVVTVDAPAPTTVTIARPGQNARYTFSGTAGQSIAVVLNGYALDDGDRSTASTAQVQLFRPSNGISSISNGTVNATTGTLTLNATLPETGNYTVAIKPNGLDSGSINLGVKHQ